MRKPFVLTLVVFCLSACYQGKDKPTPTEDSPQEMVTNTVANDSITSQVEQDSIISDRGLNILFDKVTLSFPEIFSYNDTSTNIIAEGDTLQFFEELGAGTEDKVCYIDLKSFDEVDVFHRYETSMNVSGEGPHCDLLEWKHFYSGWRKVEMLEPNRKFIMPSYSQEEREQFPEFSEEEYLAEVERYCYKGWLEMIREYDSLGYPYRYCGVTMTHLKLVLKNSKTNEEIIRYLKIEKSLGC